MTRQEAHFDAMLKHLGAMYYHTLRGEATPADVARALDTVQREASRHEGGHRPQATRGHAHRTGRWRVRDVMTTDVIAVDKRVPGTRIARLLTERRINAMPVLTGAGKVAGVVSEADLLRTQQRPGARGGLLRRRPQPGGASDYTAAQLMTSPAITIHPDAPVGAAARRMTDNHLTLLPVVDADDELIGVVSRRDLLRVFLRPDEDIVAEVRHVLADVLLIDPDPVTVTVRDGLVTLSGEVERGDLIPVAIRVVGDIDGVLTVMDHLSAPPVASARR